MERRQLERRTGRRVDSSPSLDELRAVFHRIWTTQVGQHGYSKRDWQELQRMMMVMFKVKV